MNAKKLIKIREEYKKKMERRLRDNQMKGVKFVVGQVLNELFDELIGEAEK